MSDLFQQVRDHIEAFDQITQDWQTATGTKTITQSIARPAAWIERVHERGVMTALDCVSIIVFALDDWSASPTREQQIQLTEGWAAELRKAAQDGEIQPRDPFTLLPLNCTPDGWAWGILSGDADKFLIARGMDWNCGEIAAHIYNQVLPHIDAKRFPLALRSIDKPQAAPEHAPVVEAPANEPQPLPLTTGDIAHCFAGLHWDEQQWRKPLGYPPKWLKACVHTPGQQGVSETRWNPVSIGAELIKSGHAHANNVRGRFQSNHLLKPWLELWKAYEADYLNED